MASPTQKVTVRELDDGAADPVSTLSLPFAIHDQLRTSLAFGQVNVEKLANNRDVYLAELSGDTSSLKGMPISADPNPLQPAWQKHWEEERESEEQNAMNSEDPRYKERKGPNHLPIVERAKLKNNVNAYWDKRRGAQKLLKNVYEKAAVQAVKMHRPETKRRKTTD